MLDTERKTASAVTIRSSVSNPGSSGGWEPAIDTDESFIFTLENPHNIPMRRFPVKLEKSHKAIKYSRGEHPAFGKDLVFYGTSLFTGEKSVLLPVFTSTI
jgi:hypothetical protein